jgi:ABC-type Co2+ transport system permease subunit
MAAPNPYQSPGGTPVPGVLALKDHLIAASIAAFTGLASAAVLLAFAFGAVVAFVGPYSDLRTTLPGLTEQQTRLAVGIVGTAIALISIALGLVTFFRVERGRRRTTQFGLRREELTRAVELLQQDVQRRKSQEGHQ